MKTRSSTDRTQTEGTTSPDSGPFQHGRRLPESLSTGSSGRPRSRSGERQEICSCSSPHTSLVRPFCCPRAKTKGGSADLLVPSIRTPSTSVASDRCFHPSPAERDPTSSPQFLSRCRTSGVAAHLLSTPLDDHGSMCSRGPLSRPPCKVRAADLCPGDVGA